MIIARDTSEIRRRVLLSLGSNIGDRAGFLHDAVDALCHRLGSELYSESGLYESAPLGSIEQPWFLNMAVEIETALGPLELLNIAKEIESDLGREPGRRWGPRKIDIDIVMCGDLKLELPELTIPHREFRARAFVLMPLAEIAPDAIDPVTGSTVVELLNALDATENVRKIETPNT